MAVAPHHGGEVRTALHYTLVAGVGFVIDAILLKTLIALGMEPAWARVISLFAAMQATFLINGLWVFRRLKRENFGKSWLSYMATNGFGNFCNYWIFVTLISLHRPILSAPLLDIAAGGGAAWVINYGCLRLLVFRKPTSSPG